VDRFGRLAVHVSQILSYDFADLLSPTRSEDMLHLPIDTLINNTITIFKHRLGGALQVELDRNRMGA
jgi:hypothetical protein